MAETVGQHSVAAFTSPVNGTTPIDANTVRGNDNTVRAAYVDHDADPGIHVQSSSLASRPVAGTAGRKWITVNSGRYQLWYDDGSRWHEVASDAVNIDCLADANLTKGDVVKITGFNNGQNLPTVNKVTASTDTAFGVVENTVTSGNIVQIVNTGLIEDVDTNGYAVGTILYPNSSGGWTSTKPTSGNYQPAGYVLRGNTNNGVLYVEFSAPRIVERSDNTASTIVLRDASGNFAAGTITAGALTSTGLVTFASLKGTGATTVTNILDEDNMASDSATALATQQSIKAYVDAKVATVDTLAEVLVNGNTTGARDIIVTAGQKITTDTIAETTAAAGVTIDSVLLKDDVVNATDIEVDTISANNGTLAVTLASTGVATIAQQPILSSLTASQAVFTDASKGLVSNAITGTGNVVMSASPTLTGTVTAATINATTLGGTLSTAAQPNVTSVGTLTSLTVSGAATFASSTGNVGIGTTSPVDTDGFGRALDIRSGSGGQVVIRDNDDTTKFARLAFDGGTTNIAYVGAVGSGTQLLFTAGGATVGRFDANGNLAVDTNTLYVDAANNRVGVGTATPGRTLSVQDAATDFGPQIAITNTSSSGGAVAGVQLRPDNGTTGLYVGIHRSGFSTPNEAFINQEKNAPLTFYTNNTERMRLDASGNLGIGVTPSGNYTLQAQDNVSSGFKGFRLGGFRGGASGTGYPWIGYNIRPTSSSDVYNYDAGDVASAIRFADSIRFYTAPSGTAGNAISFTQAMTLNASGQLSLGVTGSGNSPGGYFWIEDQNSATYSATVENTPSATIKNEASGNRVATLRLAARCSDGGLSNWNISSVGVGSDRGTLTFQNGTSERARIDSSGNLGIGTTSPSEKLHVEQSAVTGALVKSTGANAAYVEASGNNATVRSRLQSGLSEAFVGTLTNHPLSFQTNNAERARITSGGDLQIGGTNGTYQVNITQSAGDMIRMFRDTSNTVEMFTTSSSTNIFYITVDNSQGVSLTSGNTSWGSYSDARLKNVTGSYTNALSDVAQLEPVKFTWKSDEANKPHVGLLAQSVAPVIPEAVDTDENGMMSVRYTEVIPLLVAAIKELKATNESLEARLAALES